VQGLRREVSKSLSGLKKDEMRLVVPPGIARHIWGEELIGWAASGGGE